MEIIILILGFILGILPFLLGKILGIPLGFLIIVGNFAIPQNSDLFLSGLFSIAGVVFMIGFLFYAIGAWSEKSMQRKNEKQRQASVTGSKIVWFLSHFFR